MRSFRISKNTKPTTRPPPAWDHSESHDTVLPTPATSIEPAPEPLLVIEPPPNRDWRTESYAAQELEDKSTFGLNVFHKSNPPHTGQSPSNAPQALSIEDEARQALISGESVGAHTIPLDPESKALANDLARRPDAPDASAYERVPVELFGEALLRGMGWKGHFSSEQSPSESAGRRPDLLGLGAKPPRENGASNSLPHRDRVYVPLVQVNTRTGERVAIEEQNTTHESRSKKHRN